jgi:hypothetical protein
MGGREETRRLIPEQYGCHAPVDSCSPAFTVNSLARIASRRTLSRAFLRYGAGKGATGMTGKLKNVRAGSILAG